jgi:phosphate starvation-inducible PhoH-like protein
LGETATNSNDRSFRLEQVPPAEFYGANNTYFNYIRSFFPRLKISARGEQMTVHGEEDQIELFSEKLDALFQHFNRYNSLSERVIERIMLEGSEDKALEEQSDLLLHGTNGQAIKARTRNQKRMVQAIKEHDMLFAIGPAGTGKTYTAVALAVRALKQREVKRIILTRPAVEAGENLGFLPGDLKEKLDPFLQPLYDALRDMIPPEKLTSYIENETIQIAPLAFMRGRTLDRAFVILDEAQNTTHGQMKMFLTRMGESAKFIVNGDMTQVDLPRNQRSGLREAEIILRNVEGISFIYLDEVDVIRHKLVKKIIRAYSQEEEKIRQLQEPTSNPTS